LEGTPNGSFSVNFTATGAGTATISVQQTNTVPPFDQPTTLGQINVLAPGVSCPSPGGGGGGGGGGGAQINGSADPASLDVFPDDGYPNGFPVTTTWTIPARFGDTTVTFSSLSPLVFPSAGFPAGGYHFSDGQTISQVISFFIRVPPPVTSPVTTQLVFKAQSARGHSTQVSVPLRIEASRPPPNVQTGGHVSNAAIDFGTAWPGNATLRSLSLTNQGPALSRWQSNIDPPHPRPSPYSVVSVRAFDAQGGPANNDKCSPQPDLFGGERCEFTLQLLPAVPDRAVSAIQFNTLPAGQVIVIDLLAQGPAAQLMLFKWPTW
jgi:hypothetical protein